MSIADPSWRALPSGEVGRWRWHVATGTLEWDDACARVHGARRGEEPAETWLRVVHPADAARLESSGLWTLAEAQIFRVHDDRGVRGARGVRHLLSRVTHVEGRPGDGTAPGGWVAGLTVDVTAAQEAHGRAAAALETMTDAFLALDAELRLTYVNASAAAAFGEPAEALVGREVLEVFPELRGSVVEDAYRTALETGEVVSLDWERLPGLWVSSEVQPAAEGLHVCFRDSTAVHRAAAVQQRLVTELERQATHDALTGLTNASLLGRRAAEHLASSPSATVTVVALDLDRFGLVNDTLGHAFGDDLLTEVAARLEELAPPGALVARTAGDEFSITLFDAPAAEAEAVAHRALAGLREPVRIRHQELALTASAGLATAGPEGGVDALVRDGGIALHEAKRAGRDRVVWCDARLQADVTRRAALEHDLRRALRDDAQLDLHYQPSFSLATGLPTGVEALLRWTHPSHGPVPPAEAVPVAEESGLILPLGDWVLRRAARQALAWRDVPDLTVWANVAPRQLASGDVPGVLARLVAETGLAPQRLGIEVTESVLADGSPAGAALQEVRALGVRVAIDDFGTGYSSLARLLELPVDVVKIDRSFVTACETPAGHAVLDGIVNLAHGLGASVIAEGVETWEQLAVVRSTSCDAVTGFLLGMPVPAVSQALSRVRLSAPQGARVPRSRTGGATAAR